MNEAQAKGRRTLILIALLFALPIAAAMYLYFTAWQPPGSTANGELINPPRPLPELPINEAGAEFREVWSLVVLTGDDCPAECNQALTNVRQIRLSLANKMTRMQMVLIPAGENATATVPLEEHPRLIIGDPATGAEFHEAFGPYQNGEIFMVDPFGNLMMRYAPGTEMGDIRKDIGHLLKLSTIG